MIIVYIGKRNKVTLTLKKNNAIVSPNSVNRAVLRFGSFCIDSDIHTNIISLEENATKVQLRLGLIPNLIAGNYKAKLTIYDLQMTEGKSWPPEVPINIVSWEGCE